MRSPLPSSLLAGLARLAGGAVLFATAACADDSPFRLGTGDPDAGSAVDAAPAEPELLATLDPGSEPRALTLVDDQVYFAAGSEVRRVARAGGPVEVLGPVGGYPFAMARHGSDLLVTSYDSARGGLYRIPVTGGTAQRLVDASTPFDLAVDDAWSYWVSGQDAAGSYDNGGIYRLAHGSSSVQTVSAPHVITTSVHLDGDHVYWTTADDVFRARRSDGGGRERIGPAYAALDLAGTAARLLIANRGRDEMLDGQIVELAVGGSPVVLVEGQANPWDLHLEGDDVYWVNQGTAPARTNGGLLLLRDGQVVTIHEGADCRGLTGDAAHVYWACGGAPGGTDPATIWRIRR